MPINNSPGKVTNKQNSSNIGIADSTAAVLGKYGVKSPQIQQGNPVSVTPNKITIINNNNSTTNNKVSGGGNEGKVNTDNSASKFKTWLGKVNMQQAERASKRDRDYARRESSLTRSANKMLRRIEKVGSSVAEAFTPESFGQTIGSQLKMYLLIFGMKFLSNNWEKVLEFLGGVRRMFNSLLAWLGVGKEGEAMARKGKGLLPTVIRFLGGKPGKETVAEAFKNTVKAAVDHLSMKLEHMLSERAIALQKVKLNIDTDGLFGQAVKGLGIEDLFKGVSTYLSDIFIALADPKAGAARQVARDVQKKGLEGSLRRRNRAQYVSESFGVDKGDLAVIDKSNKARYGIIDGAIGPGNTLTSKAGGQISQSLDIIGVLKEAQATGYVDPARFLAGLERMQDKARTSGYIAVDDEFLRTFLSTQTIRTLTTSNHIRYRKYKVVKIKKQKLDGRFGDYLMSMNVIGAATRTSNWERELDAPKGLRAATSVVRVGIPVVSPLIDDMLQNDHTLELVPVDDPRPSENGKIYVLCEIDETVLKRIAQSFGVERFDTSNERLMEQARSFIYQRAGGYAATKERYTGKGRNESISVSETYKPIHSISSVQTAHKREEESHPIHQRAATSKKEVERLTGGAVKKSKELYQDTKDFFTKPTGEARGVSYDPGEYEAKPGMGPRTASSIVHVSVPSPNLNDNSNITTFSTGVLKSPIKTQYTFSVDNAVKEAQRLSRLIITDEVPLRWKTKSASEKGKSNYLAKYTRLAIAKGLGKLDLEDRPRFPFEYVNILYKYGFAPLDWKSYSPKKGDICIFGPTANKFRGGYSCIYSGSKWISDHEQNSIWPDDEFKNNNHATVFRHLNISENFVSDIINGQYKAGSSQAGFLDFTGQGQWDAFRNTDGKVYELTKEGKIARELTESEVNSRVTSESNFISSPESFYSGQGDILNYKGGRTTETDPGVNPSTTGGGFSVDLNFDGGKINNPPEVNITTSGYNLVLWRYHKLPSGVDGNNAFEGVIYEHGTGKILAWTIESEYQVARCRLNENPSEIVPGGVNWPREKPYHRGCSSYVVSKAKGRGGFGKNVGDPDTVLAVKTPSRGKTRCLFHPGADVSWSTGCILVGDKAKNAKRKVSTVEFGIDRIQTSQHPSVVYWRNLYNHVISVLCSGQKVYLYFVSGKNGDVNVGSSAGVQSAAANYTTNDTYSTNTSGVDATSSGDASSGGNIYGWDLPSSSGSGGSVTGTGLSYASYDIAALQRTALAGGIDINNPIVQAALNHVGGYTASQKNEFVRDLYISLRAAGLSHIPAVMAVAQAIQESGYGTSDSARGGNNYGGISATTRNPTWGGSGDWAGFKNMGHYAQEKARLLAINFSGALTAQTPEEYMRAVQGLDANGNPIPGAKVYCPDDTRNGVHSDRFQYVTAVINQLNSVTSRLEEESANLSGAIGTQYAVNDGGAGKVFETAENLASKASEVAQNTYNDVKRAISNQIPSDPETLTLKDNANSVISAMSDEQLASQMWLNNAAIRKQYEAYGYEGWKKYVFDKLPNRKTKERYLIEEEGKAILAANSYLTESGHWTGLQNVLGFEIDPEFLDENGGLTSEGLSLFGATYASLSPKERNTLFQRLKLESDWQAAKDEINKRYSSFNPEDFTDDELENLAAILKAGKSEAYSNKYFLKGILQSVDEDKIKSLYKNFQLGNVSEAKKILEDYYIQGTYQGAAAGFKNPVGLSGPLGGLLALSSDKVTKRVPYGGYDYKNDKYSYGYEFEDFDISDVYVKDALARAFAKKQYDELQVGINKFLESDIYKKNSELKGSYDSEGYRKSKLEDTKDFDEALSFVNGMYNLFKNKYVQTHLTEGFEDILETDTGETAYEKNQRNQKRAEINKQKYDIKYRQEHWNEDYYDQLEKDPEFKNTMYWRYGFGDEANRAMYGSQEGKDQQAEFTRQLKELDKQLDAVNGNTSLEDIDKIREKFRNVVDGTAVVSAEERDKIVNYSTTGDQIYDMTYNLWKPLGQVKGKISGKESDKDYEKSLEERARKEALHNMQEHMFNKVWLPLMEDLIKGDKPIEEIKYTLMHQGLSSLISDEQLKNIKKNKKFNENLLNTVSEVDTDGNIVTKWYGADGEEIQVEDYERDSAGNIIFDKNGNPKKVKRAATIDDSKVMEKVIEDAHKKENLMGGVKEGDVTMKINGKNLSLYSKDGEMFYLDRDTGERYDTQANKLSNLSQEDLNNILLSREGNFVGMNAPELVSQATATQHLNYEKRLRGEGFTYGGQTFKLKEGQATSDVLNTHQLDLSNYNDADSMIEGLKETLGKDVMTKDLENYLRDQYNTDKTKKVELSTFKQNGLTMSGAFVDGQFQLFPDKKLAAGQLNAIEAHAKKLGYTTEEAKIYADNQFREKKEWAEVQQRMGSEKLSFDAVTAEYITKIYDQLTIIQDLVGVEPHHPDVSSPGMLKPEYISDYKDPYTQTMENIRKSGEQFSKTTNTTSQQPMAPRKPVDLGFGVTI